MITVLDGAMGTELEARGVSTRGPAWSARALFEAPDQVRAIHEAYALAGATVHVTNTFRTTPRALGADWQWAMRKAVALCREATGPGARVAGSLAPLEDCWHPERSPVERSPAQTRAEHALLARGLARAGVDLVLCETFAHMGEALVAVEGALETGLPVWVSFTSGPWDDLCTPEQMGQAAASAVDRGVQAVLVNCTPATRILPYVEAIAAACRGRAAVGVRANAGAPEEGVGFGAPQGPERYLLLARRWTDAGCSLVGGCCGTGPAHIRALTEGLREPQTDAAWY